MDDHWASLTAALDRATGAGRQVDVWLRDDDAVTTTKALDRLAALARRSAMPVLLAVIPDPADRHLVRFVNSEPLLTPTQHGFAHVNHAGFLQRACELGLHRGRETILAELALGRDKMAALFGSRRSDILVPPWNRIAPELVPALPQLGFGGLSTYASLHANSPGLDILNAGLDIIDWRNGRVCHREDKLVSRLAGLIDDGGPVGILTHHLVHDEAAWLFLDRALDRLAAHPAVRFTAADRLRPERDAAARAS